MRFQTSTETIARPRPHPRFRAMVERLREEALLEQSWRPACARCGETTADALPAAEARAWWAKHECRVAA